MTASLLLGAALIGLSYSLPTSAVVMLTRDMSGMAQYSHVYPKITLAGTIANAPGVSLLGFMVDLFHSYVLVLVNVVCMAVFLIVITWVCYQKKMAETA